MQAAGWVHIHLSEEQVLDKVETQILSLCKPRWMVVGAPHEAALFATGKPGSGAIDLYLTARMAEICVMAIAPFNPAPCDPPRRTGLRVLLANGSAEAHFPES